MEFGVPGGGKPVGRNGAKVEKQPRDACGARRRNSQLESKLSVWIGHVIRVAFHAQVVGVRASDAAIWRRVGSAVGRGRCRTGIEEARLPQADYQAVPAHLDGNGVLRHLVRKALLKIASKAVQILLHPRWG